MKNLFRKIYQDDIDRNNEYDISNNILSIQTSLSNTDQIIKNQNTTYEDYIENCRRDYISQREWEIVNRTNGFTCNIYYIKY